MLCWCGGKAIHGVLFCQRIDTVTAFLLSASGVLNGTDIAVDGTAFPELYQVYFSLRESG